MRHAHGVNRPFGLASGIYRYIVCELPVMQRKGGIDCLDGEMSHTAVFCEKRGQMGPLGDVHPPLCVQQLSRGLQHLVKVKILKEHTHFNMFMSSFIPHILDPPHPLSELIYRLVHQVVHYLLLTST